jgi:hypothetical protein
MFALLDKRSSTVYAMHCKSSGLHVDDVVIAGGWTTCLMVLLAYYVSDFPTVTEFCVNIAHIFYGSP